MIKINDELNIYFPLKLKPREQQIKALEFIKKSINFNKKNVLLNLPTGSGKSYLIMMFTNWYKNYINNNAKFDILTNSKILQNQYKKDFPFIKDYRGRSNFYCDPYDTDCSNGYEICKNAGPHCNDCPYDIAKKAWQVSNIGLTNFHLFNTISIYAQKILEGRESSVLIIDEAHDFESVFCDFISTSLSSKSLKHYGFSLKEIEDYDDIIIKIKNIQKYIGFIKNQFLSDLNNKILYLDESLSSVKGKVKNEYTKYLNHCNTQKLKFEYLIQEYEKNPENWILDITKTTDKMYSGILLEAKPVWGNDYIKELIYDRYDHVLFLSGTILNKNMFSYLNGLEKEKTTYIEKKSDFQINRRPIYYLKLGKMTWNQKEETFKVQLEYIKKILKKNKHKKGIIHTTNYEISNWLQEKYVDSRLLFHTPENRDEILLKHIKADYPSVLVSPSMMNGVDLKDDLSRFQCILKIPFPYLGSEKIKMRQKTQKDWYSWRTIVDILQMYGRSVRSMDDWAETYILDSSFSDILKYNSNIPKWFTDAIKILKL